MSVGEPAIVLNPELEAFALSTRVEGLPAPGAVPSSVKRTTPPNKVLVREGKLSCPLFVFVMPAKVTLGLSSLYAATTWFLLGLEVVIVVATTLSLKLPDVSRVLAR